MLATATTNGLLDDIARAIQAATRVAWNLVWWDGFAHGAAVGTGAVLAVVVATLLIQDRRR